MEEKEQGRDMHLRSGSSSSISLGRIGGIYMIWKDKAPKMEKKVEVSCFFWIDCSYMSAACGF